MTAASPRRAQLHIMWPAVATRLLERRRRRFVDYWTAVMCQTRSILSPRGVCISSMVLLQQLSGEHGLMHVRHTTKRATQPRRNVTMAARRMHEEDDSLSMGRGSTGNRLLKSINDFGYLHNHYVFQPYLLSDTAAESLARPA